MAEIPLIPLIPPGLEALQPTDKVRVQETRHRNLQRFSTYDLLNSDGSLMYKVEEKTDFCGPRFTAWVRDPEGGDVFHIHLPSSGCSCESKMQVVSLREEFELGYITSSWKAFTLWMPTGEPTLQVHGPGWGDPLLADTNYTITPYDDKTPLGVITRTWRGFKKELLSSIDHYSIQFPIDLDVKIKALLVACAMFIDVEKRERR